MFMLRYLIFYLCSFQAQSILLRRPLNDQFHIPANLINNLGRFFQQDLFVEKCTFVTKGDIWSEEPLMTWRIDGTHNVQKRSNLYFNKCFIFLTLSKDWTDSEKLIEELSVYFHTLPLFVVMIHSEDDQGWADPGSKTSHLRYPTLHLTREKV